MIPEKNFVPEREFNSDINRNDLISEWLVRERNVVLVSRKHYREILGDGVNSFQNESHSDIMQIAR